MDRNGGNHSTDTWSIECWTIAISLSSVKAGMNHYLWLMPSFPLYLVLSQYPQAASLKCNSCLPTNTTEVYEFRFEFCVFAIQTSISTTPCLHCQIQTVKKLSCGHMLFAILIWLQMFLHSPKGWLHLFHTWLSFAFPACIHIRKTFVWISGTPILWP